jgi:hypothetical protein
LAVSRRFAIAALGIVALGIVALGIAALGIAALVLTGNDRRHPASWPLGRCPAVAAGGF